MTNSSCADCGRMVAFRTSDLAEIAECRNCGSWVKRKEGQPEIAVSLRAESGAAASPFALQEPAISRDVSSKAANELSPKEVYEAITDLRQAVTRLEEGQNKLLERSLPVTEMPLPEAQPRDKSSRERQKVESSGRYFTTPFSALKIPAIPASLDDLQTGRSLREEACSVSPIPADERSDQSALIHEPLPEPPQSPEPEPEAVEEPMPPAKPVFELAPVRSIGEEPLVTESEEVEEEESETIANPFAALVPAEEGSVQSPFEEAKEKESEVQNSTVAPIPSGKEGDVLARQIEAAKELTKRVKLNQEPCDQLQEKSKSSILPKIAAVLLPLLLLGGLGWLLAGKGYFSQAESTETEVTPRETAPLLQLPLYGVALEKDDARVAEAEDAARAFLDAPSAAEVFPLVRPVEFALLDNFWGSAFGATLSFYQAHELNGGRVEVDFLVQQFDSDERFLPMVMEEGGRFLADWKTFAEVEEASLAAISQGTITLKNGEEITKAAVRAWVKQDAKSEERENGAVFELFDITRDTTALAYARNGSETLEQLMEALERTEIRYRGERAIRSVLRVKPIVPAEGESTEVAKLEILEVLATDWREKERPTEDESAGPEAEPSVEEDSETIEEAPEQDTLPPIDWDSI